MNVTGSAKSAFAFLDRHHHPLKFQDLLRPTVKSFKSNNLETFNYGRPDLETESIVNGVSEI